jgi:aminopeptidase YwaD
MKYIKSSVFILFWIIATVASAQSNTQFPKKQEESMQRLKSHVSYLASDKLEGRQTGSPGELLSAQYIAQEFKKNGLKLWGKNGFQEFQMTQFRIASDDCLFQLNPMGEGAVPKPFRMGIDFYPLSLSAHNDSCTAEVVDCGYGIIAEKLNKNEFAGKPVAGKIAAIRLGFFGQEDNPHSEIAEYADIHTKVNNAIAQGAVGVILFRTDSSQTKPSGKLERNVKPSAIPVFYFAATNPPPPQLTMTMKSKILAPSAVGHNVVAYKNNFSRKTVIICAHHDHIGFNEYDNSRYSGPQAIHNGADDNASGVAAMIELSKQLNSWGYKKNNYLFIAFSGEELGLLGSKFFTKNPLIPLNKINYVLNIDMLGRIDSSRKTLTINGAGTSSKWMEIIKKLEGDTQNVRIATTESGLGPSDHASFYLENIPVLHFFSGQHRDYHTPDDDEDKINYQGMYHSIEVIKKIICQTKRKKLDFIKTKDASPGATRFKVSLGVMPDYSFSGEGMRIDGVSDGRPAAKAGLKRDDVVIKIGSETIADMNSYMSALGKFNKGDKTTIMVKRGAETLSFEIIF